MSINKSIDTNLNTRLSFILATKDRPDFFRKTLERYNYYNLVFGVHFPNIDKKLATKETTIISVPVPILISNSTQPLSFLTGLTSVNL